VKCLYDPLGTLSGTVLIPSVATTTGNNQASPTAKYTMPVYKTAVPMDPGAGYILQIDIPEPSCILALLTGIGLLALRRRR
jgi:hypothetical protein